MADWYGILKDFAGPAATVLAAGGAFFLGWRFGNIQARVAENQSAIALDKLKFDLFEKRYEIYSAAKILLEKVIHVRSLDKSDPAEIRALYIKIDESRFFFPPDIQFHLGYIHDTCEKLLRLVGEREALVKPDDHEKWALAADEIGSVSFELHNIYGELPKKFERSLAFDQLVRS